MLVEPMPERYLPPEYRVRVDKGLYVDIVIASGLAIAMWTVALLLGERGVFLVWDDQQVIFLRGAEYILRPYDVPAFFNPPVAMLMLFPFAIVPDFRIGVLLQLILLFILLTLIIRKFGGGRLEQLVVLTSVLAMESALELNIEWMVCIGLLVPPRYSLLFLGIKPQVASGYVLAFKWRQWTEAVLTVAVVTLLSFLVWGLWPLHLLNTMSSFRLALQINVAPANLLTPFISVPIGLGLAFVAFRRRDAILGVLSGLFFVPYLASYSLIIPFTLFAVRWTVAAMIFSAALWVIIVVFLVLG